MPRYYFDLRDGNACKFDDDGVILGGIKLARDEAIRRFADHVRNVLPGTDRRILAIEVRDEAKQPLLELRLVFDAVRSR
jgi:hypothetical protein